MRLIRTEVYLRKLLLKKVCENMLKWFLNFDFVLYRPGIACMMFRSSCVSSEGEIGIDGDPRFKEFRQAER